jgi:hypothetical protein
MDVVTKTTKLGWGIYIKSRLKKIRKTYHALRTLLKKYQYR